MATWKKIAFADSSQTFSGTQTIDETTNHGLVINSLANYKGIELNAVGSSRPAIYFKNANQSHLGSIFGTEGNALILATGSGGATALTLDSSQNATFAGTITCGNIIHGVVTDTGGLIYGAGSSGFRLRGAASGTETFASHEGKLTIKASSVSGGNYDLDLTASGTGIVNVTSNATFDGTLESTGTFTGTTIESFNGSHIQAKRNDGNHTTMKILNTHTGSCYLYLDASNGDLTGSDYALIYHDNSSLNLVLSTGDSAGSIVINSKYTDTVKFDGANSTFYGNVTISSTTPLITLDETDGVAEWQIYGSGNNFYIGESGEDVALFIHENGAVGINTTSANSYHSSANNLVIYESDNAGMTIATSSTGTGSIFFADGTTGDEEYKGAIEYVHGSTNELQFRANSVKGMTLDASKNLTVEGNVNVGAGQIITPSGVNLALNPNTGLVTVGGSIQASSSSNVYLSLDTTQTNGDEWKIFNVVSGSDSQLQFKNEDTSEYPLVLQEGLKTGIGTVSPDGTLHIHTATAGSITANTTYNDLVVENSTHAGISILTPNNAHGGILFGDPQDDDIGNIKYDHATNKLLLTSNGTLALTLDSSQNALFAGHVNVPAGYSFQWGDTHERIEQSDGKIEFFTGNSEKMTLSGSSLGIGTTSPDTGSGAIKLHIQSGSAGSVSAYDGDSIGMCIEASGNSGMQFLTGSNSDTRIWFGDANTTTSGAIIYTHHATATSENMDLRVNSATRVRIMGSGAVGVGTTTFGTSSASSSYKQVKISDGTIIADSGGTNTASMLLQNAYVGTSNNNFYTQASWASRIMQTTGAITFSTAASGSADAQITWSDKLIITNGGLVGINKTPDTYQLDVGGSGRFTSASGNLFKAQGSGSSMFYVGATGQVQHYSTTSNTAYILTQAGAGDSFAINSSDFIVKADGKVGIGGSTPGSILHAKEANDGGATEFILDNSAAAGSTDETVAIRLRHAGATGAKIFSERTEDFASSGAQSANLCIQTTKDGVSATRMVVADSGTTSFYGNTGVSADSKALRVGHGNDYTMMHDGTHTYVENLTGELRTYQNSGDHYSVWTKPSGGSITKRLHIGADGIIRIGNGDGVGQLNVKNNTGDLLKHIVIDTGTAQQDWSIGYEEVSNRLNLVIQKEYGDGSFSNALKIMNDGGQLQGTGGSAAKPTYSFIDQASTGMYKPGTSQLYFSVAGTRKVRMEASQIVLEDDVSVNDALTVGGTITRTATNNSAGTAWTVIGDGNIPHISIQNASTTNNTMAGLFFKDDQAHRAGIHAKFVNHTDSSEEAELIFSTASSGNTRERLTIKGNGDVYATGSIYVPWEIVHTGDTDTRITFDDNNVSLRAGNTVPVSANHSNVIMTAGSGVSMKLDLVSDNGANHADNWRLSAETDHVFEIQSKDGGSFAPVIELSGSDKKSYFKGPINVTGEIQTPGTGHGIVMGEKSSNGSPYVVFQGTNSNYNWRLRQNDNNGGDFTIKRSTATGGSTWESVPVIQITADQDVKIKNGDVTISEDLSVEGAFPFMIHASGDWKGTSAEKNLPLRPDGSANATVSTLTDLDQQMTWIAPFNTTLRSLYVTAETACSGCQFKVEVATNYAVYVNDTSTTTTTYTKNLTTAGSTNIACGLSISKGNAIRLSIDPNSTNVDQFLVTLVFE